MIDTKTGYRQFGSIRQSILGDFWGLASDDSSRMYYAIEYSGDKIVGPFADLESAYRAMIREAREWL